MRVFEIDDVVVLAMPGINSWKSLDQGWYHRLQDWVNCQTTGCVKSRAYRGNIFTRKSHNKRYAEGLRDSITYYAGMTNPRTGNKWKIVILVHSNGAQVADHALDNETIHRVLRIYPIEQLHIVAGALRTDVENSHVAGALRNGEIKELHAWQATRDSAMRLARLTRRFGEFGALTQAELFERLEDVKDQLRYHEFPGEHSSMWDQHRFHSTNIRLFTEIERVA